MPVSIGEVSSTVEVERASGEGHGGDDGGTKPSPESVQRWLEMARRAEELAARTAAWRFDD
jgi:hypothetical protein